MESLKKHITNEKEPKDIILDNEKIDKGLTSSLLLRSSEGHLFDELEYIYYEKESSSPYDQLANEIYKCAQEIGIMGELKEIYMDGYKYIQLKNKSKIWFKKQETSEKINNIYNELLDIYIKQVEDDKQFLTVDFMDEVFGKRSTNKHQKIKIDFYFLADFSFDQKSDPNIGKWYMNYKWTDEEFQKSQEYYYQQHSNHQQLITEGSHHFSYFRNQLFDEIVLIAFVETLLNWQENVEIICTIENKNENLNPKIYNIAIGFKNNDEVSFRVHNVNIYNQIKDMVEAKQKKDKELVKK